MSGCGTSLEGRAIVMVYENGISVDQYDRWVKNYISVQQSIAEGRIKPEFADWSDTNFYMKEANDQTLWQVNMERNELEDGRVRISWTTWSTWDDEEVAYAIRNEPLEFTFDPYEGLARYVLTIVPRESADEPIPADWNGTLIFSADSPIYGTQLGARDVWKWVDAHTLDVGISGDVLVTPYGEDTGVPADVVIATREIAVRKGS